MNKGLKALEELKFQVGNITYCTHDLQITTFKVRDSGLFEIIEKELQTLEIIKKYLSYNDSWYMNQAQYGYEQIFLQMENSPFASDKEKEDLIKVKEWLNNES